MHLIIAIVMCAVAAKFVANRLQKIFPKQKHWLNKTPILIICLFLFLAGTYTENNRNLLGEFALDKEQLPNITTISANKAVVIDCSVGQFAKIRQKLKENGFENWSEFHGVLGVDDIAIFDFVSRPLQYSFKFVDGKKVSRGFYSPVAVYDKQNQKLYLLMASDFGG